MDASSARPQMAVTGAIIQPPWPWMEGEQRSKVQQSRVQQHTRNASGSALAPDPVLLAWFSRGPRTSRWPTCRRGGSTFGWVQQAP